MEQATGSLRTGQRRAPTPPEREAQRALAGEPRTLANSRAEDDRVKALKRLQGELKQIGGRWSLVVEGLDDAEGVKLWSLEATGRPVLEVTDALRKAIEDEVRKALEGATEFDAQVFAEAAGKAAKRVVLLRFEKQGGDVHWAPLDPDYKAAKARAGLSTKIGIATGALLAALKAANFTLVKRY